MIPRHFSVSDENALSTPEADEGLSLVVVDYLQLMRPAVGTRPESRVLEISMITQGLKAIAKELEVPVIALSQLSRQVESRRQTSDAVGSA